MFSYRCKRLNNKDRLSDDFQDIVSKTFEVFIFLVLSIYLYHQCDDEMSRSNVKIQKNNHRVLWNNK